MKAERILAWLLRHWLGETNSSHEIAIPMGIKHQTRDHPPLSHLVKHLSPYSASPAHYIFT